MTCPYSINENPLVPGRTGFAALAITSADYLKTIRARLLSGHLPNDDSTSSPLWLPVSSTKIWRERNSQTRRLSVTP